MGNQLTTTGKARLDEETKCSELLAQTSKTSTFTPDGVDRTGYNSALFLVSVNETTGTGTWTVAIADGTTAAGCTATAAADLGQSDTPDDLDGDSHEVIFVDCRKMDAYISLVFTAASSPTYTFQIDVVLGSPTGEVSS